MAPGVSEVILRAKHESKTFHDLRFSKKGVETPKSSIFFTIFEEL